MIKGVLLDLSGVIYVGNNPIAGALTAIDRLHTNHFPIRFITNTTRSTRAAIIKKLAKMNLDISKDQLFTAPLAAQSYIREKNLCPFLLIHPDLHPEFSEFKHQEFDSVLLGDAGSSFTYEMLNAAFQLLFEGAPLLAMGDNRYFKEESGFSLDTGPFVHALEYASGAKATILGKPAKEFFHQAIKEFSCPPDQVMMVGDDVEADVNGALDAGLQAILVRTGKYRPNDEQQITATSPLVANDISEAVDMVLSKQL